MASAHLRKPYALNPVSLNLFQCCLWNSKKKNNKKTQLWPSLINTHACTVWHIHVSLPQKRQPPMTKLVDNTICSEPILHVNMHMLLQGKKFQIYKNSMTRPIPHSKTHHLSKKKITHQSTHPRQQYRRLNINQLTNAWLKEKKQSKCFCALTFKKKHK